jgi:hypothetical protein
VKEKGFAALALNELPQCLMVRFYHLPVEGRVHHRAVLSTEVVVYLNDIDVFTDRIYIVLDPREVCRKLSFDLHGTVDCEPNEGPSANPVTVTIAFDRGENLAYEIHTLQATEESSYEFVRTPDIDPVQCDAATWSVGHGVYLSGKNGVVLFSVRNTNAEIGRGDIDINGGKPAS